VPLAVPGCGSGADDEADADAVGLLTAGYDPETGRLQLIEYDADENGTVDTRTYMDGSVLLRVEIDNDEDGRVDRWEYYDADRNLERIGISSLGDGVVDSWLFEGANGIPDRWETFTEGRMATLALDDNGDDRPDRRLSYDREGRLSTIASDPDETGAYTSTVEVPVPPSEG
jgi:hypothetical protein|tara:strand:+ start:2621 stop:3136 length:516 start_codon:yes stop_codon:yes gene_type:complete